MKLMALLVLAASSYLHHPVAARDIAVAPVAASRVEAVHIVAARADMAHGQWVLTCRDPKNPTAPAFAVTVRASEQELRGALPQAIGAGAARRPTEPPAITAGHEATLTIADPGFNLATTVVALENGRMGQTIRVRSLATQAVITAQVTGPNQVEKHQP